MALALIVNRDLAVAFQGNASATRLKTQFCVIAMKLVKRAPFEMKI